MSVPEVKGIGSQFSLVGDQNATIRYHPRKPSRLALCNAQCQIINALITWQWRGFEDIVGPNIRPGSS